MTWHGEWQATAWLVWMHLKNVENDWMLPLSVRMFAFHLTQVGILINHFVHYAVVFQSMISFSISWNLVFDYVHNAAHIPHIFVFAFCRPVEQQIERIVAQTIRCNSSIIRRDAESNRNFGGLHRSYVILTQNISNENLERERRVIVVSVAVSKHFKEKWNYWNPTEIFWKMLLRT